MLPIGLVCQVIRGDGHVNHRNPTQFDRFSERLASEQSKRAQTVDLRPRTFLRWLDFPFVSVSMLVVLGSLFMLSMYLGGWTWSSWTYAIALGISIPMTAVEIRRKAVITGGAALLLVFTVIIDAGLPRYFGYTPSDLNWYDNLAHYLGTLMLTFFLWSLICWTLHPQGPPRENGRMKFYITVVTMLLVSVCFEFTEFFTDSLFGWTNFHMGVDTVGDLIFDTAGIATAAILIARHRVSVMRRPFWAADAQAS